MGEISYPMPRTPRVGNRMTADWGGSLMRSIGSLRPVGVPGMLISRGMYGTRFTPLLDGRTRNYAPQAATLAPWTVRHFDATTIPGDGAQDQAVAEGWCVYLPDGAATLYAATVHLLPYEAADGWYRVSGAESFSAGDDFQIIGHLKRRVVAGATNADGEDAVPVLYASAHPWPSAGASDATDVELASAGDTWNTVVARVSWSGSGDNRRAEVLQYFSGPLVLEEVSTNGVLPLYWTTAAPGDDGWTKFVPAVQGTTEAPLCGQPLDDAPLPIPAQADEEVKVYYQIDCSGNTPTPSLSTQHITQDAEYYTISVAIYTLRNGRLLYDTRSALAEQVYYP